MLNQVIIVGRLVQIVDLGENKGALISIKNMRPFKNADGIYEEDIIDVRVFDGVKNALVEYCKQGDMVGVRGRVQTRIEDDKKVMEIMGDKITFLSRQENQPSSVSDQGEEDE